MLIVYDPDTGSVLDNTGTNSAWVTGPPEDRAYVNTDKRGYDRESLALLRLHDVDDADQVEEILASRYHVDPDSGEVVIDAPYPSLTVDELTVTYTDLHPDAPAQVDFVIEGEDTEAVTVDLTDGEASVTLDPDGDVEGSWTVRVGRRRVEVTYGN